MIFHDDGLDEVGVDGDESRVEGVSEMILEGFAFEGMVGEFGGEGLCEGDGLCQFDSAFHLN